MNGRGWFTFDEFVQQLKSLLEFIEETNSAGATVSHSVSGVFLSALFNVTTDT